LAHRGPEGAIGLENRLAPPASAATTFNALLDALNAKPGVETRPCEGDNTRRIAEILLWGLGESATRRKVDSSHDEGQPFGCPSHASIRDWLVGEFVRSGINAAPACVPIKVNCWRTVGYSHPDGWAIRSEVIITGSHVVKQRWAIGIEYIITRYIVCVV